MRVLVTGANGALGAAMTSYCLARGDAVAGTDNAGIDCLAEPGFTSTAMDVTDQRAVAAAVAAAVDALGGLDAVVHCAGIGTVGAVLDLGIDEWDRCLAVNATGTFNVMRSVLPFLIRGGGGSIVNVASIAAVRGMRQAAAYAASKGAVVSLTLAIARDYAQHRVRANVVLPGTFVSPLSEALYAARDPNPAEAMSRAGDSYPLGRLGSAADIVALIYVLLGPESPWTTGASISIDGGLAAIAGS